MRHAFLIIAHNEFGVLRRLVSMLDSEGNDIYIHYDLKVRELPVVTTKASRLFVVPKRIDVRWGTVSQIAAELTLFEAALKNGEYDFYHLISGTHLPLKSIGELDSFYQSHKRREVMRVWEEDPGDADFKIRRYHLFNGKIKSGHDLAWRIILKIQKLFGIRHLKKETFIKTDNWKSLTQKAVEYLVENKAEILRKYRRSLCGDEYYAASELAKYPGLFRIKNCPELLYVEFDHESPLEISLDRYEELRKTGYIWGRKFTERI